MKINKNIQCCNFNIIDFNVIMSKLLKNYNKNLIHLYDKIESRMIQF